MGHHQDQRQQVAVVRAVTATLRTRELARSFAHSLAHSFRKHLGIPAKHRAPSGAGCSREHQDFSPLLTQSTGCGIK